MNTNTAVLLWSNTWYCRGEYQSASANVLDAPVKAQLIFLSLAAAPQLASRGRRAWEDSATTQSDTCKPAPVPPTLAPAPSPAPAPAPAHSVEAAKAKCFSTKWYPAVFTQPRHRHTAYTQHTDFIYRGIMRPPKLFVDSMERHRKQFRSGLHRKFLCEFLVVTALPAP